LKAHKHLPVLRAALAAHQCKYVTQKLNTTLMPHSITHGDACFAYFNKIWGIPQALSSKTYRSTNSRESSILPLGCSAASPTKSVGYWQLSGSQDEWAMDW
jgi:hypothetical protein